MISEHVGEGEEADWDGKDGNVNSGMKDSHEIEILVLHRF